MNSAVYSAGTSQSKNNTSYNESPPEQPSPPAGSNDDVESSSNGSRSNKGESASSAATDLEMPPTTASKHWMQRVGLFVSDGGTVFDGFLLAASQEVGQSILTLPYIFSLVGMGAGISLQFVFATLALYTNFLLVTLHTEFRARLARNKETDPRSTDPAYIVSYHDIIGGLLGPTARNVTLTVVFFALLGLTTVQIIATSSNFYILSDALPKRTWSLIWGGLFSLVAFVPTFRHYRILSVLGILTTTYTSWFMCTAAAIEGPDDETVHDAPRDMEEFFQGLVSILFIFGGHASNIEVADVMDNPSAYDKSYNWSYLYVFTLTLPNAISAYRTYGSEARSNPNSFHLFPPSAARDFAIVMMSLHQLVAFGLFIGPLFHMWEKLLGVHDKRFFPTRVACRLPLCAIILLVAIAFPFFGAINAVLGAFTTSLGTYIIPMVTFNLVYQKMIHRKPTTKTTTGLRYSTSDNDDDSESPKSHHHDNGKEVSNDPTTEVLDKKLPPWINLSIVIGFNWILAIILLFAGVGLGGWSSIKNFIKQIENFDYFAECYQC